MDVRTANSGARLASRPWTLALDSGGVVVLFRWGAVVFFDAAVDAVEAFLRTIGPVIEQPYARPETETVLVHIAPDGPEGFDGGVVRVKNSGIERLQTLANVLGKTVALAQYESDVAAHFDLIEPFALDISHFKSRGRRLRQLLLHIGRVLLDEQKLLGRVEVAEKP